MRHQLAKLHHFLFGPPLNPKTKSKNILLAAFFAWIGLGADGLSSSCYGPEEAFLALSPAHAQLGFYLALATAFTVFVIALSYNQVIELFPTGGGGYKVASTLINPTAGVISGSALVIDYILTITISVASGIDALFSLLPTTWQSFKWPTEFFIILLLTFLNLRGVKESIKILMPIFLGFFVSHLLLISYGIFSRAEELPHLIPDSILYPFQLTEKEGFMFVAALFLRAYSLGGGTYTGIEAVSNNINILAEPRITTGKWTMAYMALSLSFVAGGILLLYLLWHVTPVMGQTLNAVTFSAILQHLHWGDTDSQWIMLSLTLFFEASLLFVAANTGFLGGPAVLANMASDCWVPSQFRHLSTRLVNQHGIIFMALSAMFILLITHGRVKILVILYSINVFLTFTLTLLGLCIHWWENKRQEINWFRKFLLSSFGLFVCSSILVIIIFEKFLDGGWITLLLTSIFVVVCHLIKNHYNRIDEHLNENVTQYYKPKYIPTKFPPEIDTNASTAVILVDKTLGLGMHTLQQIQHLFPNVYKNFIFVSIGEINADVFRKEEKEKELIRSLTDTGKYFVNYCHTNGIPSESYYALGTDTIDTLVKLTEKIKRKYPNSVFFAGEVLFDQETWFTQWLYDHTTALMQHALHFEGVQMVLLPMKINV